MPLSIRENLSVVNENIGKAAIRSGRPPGDITLVAVTKSVDAKTADELIKLGITDLGENRVQELINKANQLCGSLNWHLIGHLQTNKVRQVIGRAALIQSVDSERLADQIDIESKKTGTRTDILIEVNIANETTKFGQKPEDMFKFVEHLCSLPNICIKGLMCVAPFVNNPDDNRPYFRQMAKLYLDINNSYRHNTEMKFLSMGMTNDYMVAVEEGANMVRIGTALYRE